MIWQANIIGQRENSVPDGAIYVTAQFTADGREPITREFKFMAGQFAGAEDMLAHIANEASKIAALDEASVNLTQLTTLVSTPRLVTNFQARAAMMRVEVGEGTLFDMVDAYCKNAGGAALQAWEYANNFYRDGVFVTSMAPAFGLTDEAVDELFRQASQIEA